MGRFRKSETCKAFNSESRLGVRWSELCILNQMISFDAWIFRKRRGFFWLHGLSKTNLVTAAFLSIHASVVISDLRNSSDSVQPTETEGMPENSERIVSEQMFPASIRLANKSAWSSSSEVLLHVVSDLINFRVFWVKIHFGVWRSRRYCYLKQKSVDCGVPAQILCGKMAPTLVQNTRPDWDSQSVRSRFDVTVLTLPRFPMRGSKPLETRFWRDINIRGFNQSLEKFCANLLHKISVSILAKKKNDVRCTLTWWTSNAGN